MCSFGTPQGIILSINDRTVLQIGEASVASAPAQTPRLADPHRAAGEAFADRPRRRLREAGGERWRPASGRASPHTSRAGGGWRRAL